MPIITNQPRQTLSNIDLGEKVPSQGKTSNLWKSFGEILNFLWKSITSCLPSSWFSKKEVCIISIPPNEKHAFTETDKQKDSGEIENLGATKPKVIPRRVIQTNYHKNKEQIEDMFPGFRPLTAAERRTEQALKYYSQQSAIADQDYFNRC